MISIHALREEGDTTLLRFVNSFFISIHALREEGDGASAPGESGPCYFYPRPPRGGRRAPAALPTLPDHFYPRPPRGGRHRFPRIRLPLLRFLSTPSARRATGVLHKGNVQSVISIHALREEGDPVPSSETTSVEDFYPRPPRGGRPALLRCPGRSAQFLSTPSARRATHGCRYCFAQKKFLSTPSARRATSRQPPALSWLWKFLSTPSARRATGYPAQALWPCRDFYPRPPRGGRHLSFQRDHFVL